MAAQRKGAMLGVVVHGSHTSGVGCLKSIVRKYPDAVVCCKKDWRDGTMMKQLEPCKLILLLADHMDFTMKGSTARNQLKEREAWFSELTQHGAVLYPCKALAHHIAGKRYFPTCMVDASIPTLPTFCIDIDSKEDDFRAWDVARRADESLDELLRNKPLHVKCGFSTEKHNHKTLVVGDVAHRAWTYARKLLRNGFTDVVFVQPFMRPFREVKSLVVRGDTEPQAMILFEDKEWQDAMMTQLTRIVKCVRANGSVFGESGEPAWWRLDVVWLWDKLYLNEIEVVGAAFGFGHRGTGVSQVKAMSKVMLAAVASLLGRGGT